LTRLPRAAATAGTVALKALIRAWIVASSDGTILATSTVADGRAARIWSISAPSRCGAVSTW
jgi:hypothetical protein